MARTPKPGGGEPTSPRRVPRDRSLAAHGTTREAEALIAEVIERPADDAPRLVYADYLASLGDPRGEYIALAIANFHAGTDAPRDAERAREAELLAKHKDAWVGSFKSDASTVVFAGRRYTHASPTSWSFTRGFVDGVTMSASTFGQVSGLLLAREPVRRVKLTHGPIAAALRGERVAGLRELDLGRVRLKDEAPVLFASDALSGLTHLDLTHTGLGLKGSRALASAASEHFPRLRELVLSDCALSDAALGVLGGAPLIQRAHSLTLDRDSFGSRGITVLVARAAELELLSVNSRQLDASVVDGLLASHARRSLQSLTLRGPIGQPGLEALLGGDWPKLEALHLPAAALPDAAADALLAANWTEQLQVLDLSENNQPWASSNQLSPAAVTRLRERFGARLRID